MKQDLIIFDKMFSRMLNSKRGNLSQHDVDGFKYTFSRIGKLVLSLKIFKSFTQTQIVFGSGKPDLRYNF